MSEQPPRSKQIALDALNRQVRALGVIQHDASLSESHRQVLKWAAAQQAGLTAAQVTRSRLAQANTQKSLAASALLKNTLANNKPRIPSAQYEFRSPWTHVTGGWTRAFLRAFDPFNRPKVQVPRGSPRQLDVSGLLADWAAVGASLNEAMEKLGEQPQVHPGQGQLFEPTDVEQT